MAEASKNLLFGAQRSVTGRKTIASSMQAAAELREEEAQESLQRAKNIRHLYGNETGLSVPEAMQEVTTNVLQVLREAMTPEPDLSQLASIGGARFLPDLYEADHADQRTKEGAVVRIQSVYRAKNARTEQKERRESIAQNNSMFTGIGAQDKVRSAVGDPSLDMDLVNKPKRSKKVDWDPQELKSGITDILNQLQTDETQNNLLETEEAINRCVLTDIDSVLEVRKRTEAAEQVLKEADAWELDVQRRLMGAQMKIHENARDCSDNGALMTALGRKALEEQHRLEEKLREQDHLVIGERALKELELLRVTVQHLGSRLLEVRSTQETTGGPQEEHLNQITELQDGIVETEHQLGVLRQWFENIQRQLKTLEATVEYLERDQKGPSPDEGVLETLYEVKGLVLTQTIEPMLRQQDLENNDTLTLPPDCELDELEEECKHLHDVFGKLTDALKQVPGLEAHEDKVKTRMAQICGPFETSSGILEHGTPPQITADEVPEMRSNLIVELDRRQQLLKPGLKVLSRLEANLTNAQQSLEALAAQRAEVMQHVKTVKDPLIKETMAVEPEVEHEWQKYDASLLLPMEERFRQCIKAFHVVEDQLCGGVEEIDARLNFAKMLVDEGLKNSDKVRRHCDRNRWEISDLLKNCQTEDTKKDAEEEHVHVSLLNEERSKLVKGAIAVRQRQWLEELEYRCVGGREAARHTRELAAQKAAIVAEVEAQAAAVKFCANVESRDFTQDPVVEHDPWSIIEEAQEEEEEEEDDPDFGRRSNTDHSGRIRRSLSHAKRGARPLTPPGEQSEAASPKLARNASARSKFAYALKAVKVAKGKSRPKSKSTLKKAPRNAAAGADDSPGQSSEPDSPRLKKKNPLGRQRTMSVRALNDFEDIVEEDEKAVEDNLAEVEERRDSEGRDSYWLENERGETERTEMSALSDTSSVQMSSSDRPVSAMSAISTVFDKPVSAVSDTSSVFLSPPPSPRRLHTNVASPTASARNSHRSQGSSSSLSAPTRQVTAASPTPATGRSTPTLPPLPPAAQTAQDIHVLHQICLELAKKVSEASENGEGLAKRLGGHPLDPARHHLLHGKDNEKKKVKQLMEGMIATRKSWWQSRQCLTVSCAEQGRLDHGKEAITFAQTKHKMRRAAHKDTSWLNHHAARLLQNFIRPCLEGGRNAKLAQERRMAVIKIQTMYRCWTARRVVRYHRERCKAANDIQRVVRGCTTRAYANDLKVRLYAAAIAIQSIVRGHLARKLAKKKRAVQELGGLQRMHRFRSAELEEQHITSQTTGEAPASEVGQIETSAATPKDHGHRDALTLPVTGLPKSKGKLLLPEGPPPPKAPGSSRQQSEAKPDPLSPKTPGGKRPKGSPKKGHAPTIAVSAAEPSTEEDPKLESRRGAIASPIVLDEDADPMARNNFPSDALGEEPAAQLADSDAASSTLPSASPSRKEKASHLTTPQEHSTQRTGSKQTKGKPTMERAGSKSIKDNKGKRKPNAIPEIPGINEARTTSEDEVR